MLRSLLPSSQSCNEDQAYALMPFPIIQNADAEVNVN